MGKIYLELKEFDSAKDLLTKVVDKWSVLYGEEHLNTHSCRHYLIECAIHNNGVKKIESNESCAYCGIISIRQLCTRCKSVSYCCRDHQKLDWKTHKLVCKSSNSTTELNNNEKEINNIEPNDMSIKDLKSLLNKIGLQNEMNKCTEKSELIELLVNHRIKYGTKKETEPTEMEIKNICKELVKERNKILQSINLFKSDSNSNQIINDQFQQLLDKYINQIGENHIETYETYFQAGTFGDLNEKYLRIAFAGFTKHYGAVHFSTLQCGNLLGNKLVALQKYKEANIIYTKAYNGFLKLFGPNDYLTNSAKMGVEMTSGYNNTFKTPEDDTITKFGNLLSPYVNSYSKTLSKERMYETEIRQLNEMGFTNDLFVERALAATKGNVELSKIKLMSTSGV